MLTVALMMTLVASVTGQADAGATGSATGEAGAVQPVLVLAQAETDAAAPNQAPMAAVDPATEVAGEAERGRPRWLPRRGAGRVPEAAATVSPEPAPARDASVVATAVPPASPRGSGGAARPGNKGVVVRPEDEIDFELRQRKGTFRFEFAKAEIIDIVKAISDMTRQNFVIAEKIKGQRLTILSPTQITASEAYRVFFTALAANGISVVRVGKFYKLVESKDAAKDTIPTCTGSEEECLTEQEQMVTVILRLRYTDASQINGVVNTLISKEGSVTVFQPTNSIIVSEYAPNLNRIRKIVDALDVPGFDDELRLVKIEYATATEIAEKLTQIFDVQGGRGARSGSAASPAPMPRGAGGDRPTGGSGESEEEVQISKILPDDRTNQIIIKANRRSFDAIKGLIAKLDVPISDSEQGRVHVHYLANAKAEDLASTLSALAAGQPKRQAGGGQAGAAGARSGAESAELFEGEIKITADKSTNSLIVVAGGRDWRSLRELVDKLDTPRRQVYVEAAVIEVTVNNDEQFETRWHAPGRFSSSDLGGAGGRGTVGFIQSAQNSGGISPTMAGVADPVSLMKVASGSIAGIVGKTVDVPLANGSTISVPAFGMILKWLETSSKANILSTPHILTTDNEQASIEVGKKIPFQRGTALPSLTNIGTTGSTSSLSGAMAGLGGLGGLGGLYSSVDRIDVSLKLEITPQINERNKIRLEIDQKIEDVLNIDETTRQPVTSNRSAKTVLVVEDQQTVVLGGLMRDKAGESFSKIPILGDIPIIGWFFKQRNKQVEKTNLLLVLTPYIINNSTDFQRIFERKLREHEEFTADYYGNFKHYRAHIDYARKTGPFGFLSARVSGEMSKLENGGGGDGSELLVQPRAGANKATAKQPAEPSPKPPQQEAAEKPAAAQPPEKTAAEPASRDPAEKPALEPAPPAAPLLELAPPNPGAGGEPPPPTLAPAAPEPASQAPLSDVPAVTPEAAAPLDAAAPQEKQP